MASLNWIDYFSLIKGVAAPSGRTYKGPLGDQNSFVSFPGTTVDISKGDFTIEGKFRIDTLFEPAQGGDPTPRYAIIGQYDGYLWDGTGTEENWWALEFIDDEFRFRVWDHSSGTYIADLTGPCTIDWESVWTDNQKANVSAEEYIYFAVVRYGDLSRIWANGVRVDESAITDWDTITNAIEVNGQDGRALEDIPYSVTSIPELRILDYALYWDNDYNPRDFSGRGIGIFPRMFPVLINGIFGDIRAKLSISPRFHSHIDVSPLVNARFAISPCIKSTSTWDIVPEPGFSITVPMITAKLEGMLSAQGTLNIETPAMLFYAEGSDAPRGSFEASVPKLLFYAQGVVGEVGTLNIVIPALTAIFSAVEDVTGIINVYIPAPQFSFNLAEGATGSLYLDLPTQTIHLSGNVSSEGTMNISLPMFRVSFSFLPKDYLSMVMNIKNRALTEYSNYSFNSLCSFNGKSFGATSTAIYELTGDTDTGTLIDWNFRTGYLDLEQKFKKKLKQAWFSYKTDGDLILTVIQPNGESYEYHLEGIDTTETGVRVKFGKGIRSKYVALDVKNLDGSTITLDVLKLHLEKLVKPR
jgi:hypothetical protein